MNGSCSRARSTKSKNLRDVDNKIQSIEKLKV